MNQDKMGKLIAKIRKEKGMTQDELGKKLNVNGKAVSKWECGVSIPDVSILNDLAEILGINTGDLLRGEDKRNQNATLKLASWFKSHFISCLLVLIFSIFAIFLLNFFIINYNNYGIIKFSSENNRFLADGIITYTPEEEIVILNKINYQSEDTGTYDEEKITKLNIYLMKNNEKILTYTLNEKFDDYGNIIPYYISDAIKEVSIIVSNIQKSNKIHCFENEDKLYLRIEYLTTDNELIQDDVELKIISTISSNKFLKYK